MSAMTNKQFIVVISTIILLLLTFMGVEKYRDCQQFGSHHCELGPIVSPVP